jgi:hypothetical protein
MQIFIPNVSGATPDHLREVGLEELLRLEAGDTGPNAVDVVSNGPGGHRGVIFYWPGCPGTPGFHPEQQTWHAAKPDPNRNLPAGRFHICVDGATPETLARRSKAQLAGFPVELGDGHDWIVPNGMKLPFRFAVGEQGETIRLPKRNVERIHERTLWAFKTLEASMRAGVEIDFDESIAYAAEMLSLNYRVNREICLLLDLFDGSNVGRLMARSTDLEKLLAIAEEVKKNAASAPNG